VAWRQVIGYFMYKHGTFPYKTRHPTKTEKDHLTCLPGCIASSQASQKIQRPKKKKKKKKQIHILSLSNILLLQQSLNLASLIKKEKIHKKKETKTKTKKASFNLLFSLCCFSFLSVL
jgi:hypothetical protein